MKLFEKLKNTFFEEEYVEVEEKPTEVAKKVETRSVPKEIKREEEKPVVKYNYEDEEKIIEEKKEPEIEKSTPSYSDRDLVKKNSKLNYFDDDDFIEDTSKDFNREFDKPKKIYGEEDYDVKNNIDVESKSNGPYNAPIKGRFQPTPIISPIYGILDKNYRKEEVIDRKDKPSSFVSRKNADLDSIRRKAYGDVSILEEKKQPEEEEIKEDPLLYDMMVDDTKPVVDQVTIADAEEYFADLGLEYNVDYKDGRYEKATGRRVNSNTNIDKKKEDNDDANLNDNLFDLVDSMYGEGE